MTEKMRKRTLSLALIALLVLAGVLVTAGAAAPSIKQLATPQLVSPHNAEKISFGAIQFDWRDVYGATRYTWEFQKATIIGRNIIEWTSEEFYTSDKSDFTYIGILPGYYRWRVTAEKVDYPFLNSKSSSWRTFTVLE